MTLATIIKRFVARDNKIKTEELTHMVIGGRVLRVGGISWLPQQEAAPSFGSGGLCSSGIDSIEGSSALFLPFAPNGINCVVTNADVVSYKFSGCIMAAFNGQGERTVCHVSIGLNQDCKDAWEDTKNRVANVVEFKPTDHIPFDRIESQKPFYVGCYGLMTEKNKAYSIAVYKDPRDEPADNCPADKPKRFTLRVFSITHVLV